MRYSGRIENGVVVEAIVGDDPTALALLGGEWHSSDTPIVLGSTWDAEHGFIPPAPPEPDTP